VPARSNAIAPVTAAQVARANATGRVPVALVRGLWLLSNSWERWALVFDEAGYAPLAPGWPDDPGTVEAARARPEVFARLALPLGAV
jgi:non-heme chloroperoxidase